MVNSTTRAWLNAIYDAVFQGKISSEDLEKLSCINNRIPHKLCCSCGADCKLTKDCCLDFFFQKNPLPAQKYIKNLVKKGSNADDHADEFCTPVIPNTL